MRGTVVKADYRSTTPLVVRDDRGQLHHVAERHLYLADREPLSRCTDCREWMHTATGCHTCVLLAPR